MESQHIVELVRALAWPISFLFIAFLFGDTISEFLRGISQRQLKSLNTPVGGLEFFEQLGQAEQELKEKISLAEEDDKKAAGEWRGSHPETDSESGQEHDEAKLLAINLEFKVLYLEQMIGWILTNNTAFVKDLSRETTDKFRHYALESLRTKYPDIVA